MPEISGKSTLILLICILSFFKPISTKSSDIVSNIIEKYYTNVQKNPLFGSLSEPSQPIKPIKHQCIHEQVALAHNTEVKKRTASVQTLQTRNETKIKKDVVAAPIRVFVDGYLLNGTGSDPRACYQQGHIVKLNVNGNDIDYTCKYSDVVTPQLEILIKEAVLPALLEVFETVLKIKYPVADNLILNEFYWNAAGGQCGKGVNVPREYTITGVPNSDFIVFATVRPIEESGVLAYALPCNFDEYPNTYGRPLAGAINFNPLWFIPYTQTQLQLSSFEEAIRIGIHELTHALGFTSGLYNYYVNADGIRHNPTPYFTEVKNGVNPSGGTYSKTLGKLRSPALLSFAKDHFGCPSLNGIELEDFGGSGTAGSHWESRVAGMELMCGYLGPYTSLSGLTLSLFEDMGWYEVDHSKSEYYGWGKGQGCDFLADRCENSWPNKDSNYWCSSGVNPGCSADRKSKALCKVGLYNSALDNYYQHFSNPRVGGTSSPFDYCPVYYPEIICRNSELKLNTSIHESNAVDSVCWEYKLGDGTNNFNVSNMSVNEFSTDIVCYQFHCNESYSLFINISGSLFECPTGGGVISVAPLLNNGFVNCPSSYQLCGVIQDYGNNDNIVTIPQSIIITTGNTPLVSTTEMSSTTASSTTSESTTGQSITTGSIGNQTISSTTGTTGTSTNSIDTTTTSDFGQNIDNSSESNSSSGAVIIGATIAAGVVVLALFAIALYMLLIRKREQTSISSLVELAPQEVKPTSEKPPTESTTPSTKQMETSTSPAKPVETPRSSSTAPNSNEMRDYTNFYPEWLYEKEDKK